MAIPERTGVYLVTLSASYGAGGSIVGPAIADRLGVPFLDRAIPAAVARTLEVPLDHAVARDEKPPSVMRRLFASMADAGSPFGVTLGGGDFTVGDEDAFRSTTERVLREVGASGTGVILGRAAAVVLADQPSALHVRLDGHRAARIARVMEYEHLSEHAASGLLDQTDRAWESYVRYFYKTDPHDPGLYHLILDSTVIPLESCTDLIIRAAAAVPR